MWFVEALARKGHSIVAVGRGEQGSHSGLHAERLVRAANWSRPLWNAPFGSPRFLEIIAEEGPFEVLCHHGAETAGYRGREFDCAGAVASNARSLPAVLAALKASGCGRIVLTDSVFAGGGQAGATVPRAFNGYGLSKALTSRIFEFYAEQEGVALGRFVIPNPFGPYEEPRFTDYLVRSWRKGKTALVSTPRYVRDNVHVSLLSECYCEFVESLPRSGYHSIGPSGYVETQGAFAARFAREIGTRLKLETPLEMARQRTFDEPAVCINSDLVAAEELDWDEGRAWDELADYYAELYDIARR
jgi:nucleoside-diphosphate-sugar epimerase